MQIYYNENDAYPASWSANLAEAGLIPRGIIDERSIRELAANDVRRYRQCHFFAGIAGWSRALELAGWPDDRPVWTGSCPCQPFSQAGKRRAFDDPRDLWPVWRKLIAECRPATIFGEQVASPDGFLWLDRVRTDLEKIGYAVGAAVLPATSVNAPHQRHRIWFVADTGQFGWRRRGDENDRGTRAVQTEGSSATSRLGDTGSERLQKRECVGKVRQNTSGTPKGETAICTGEAIYCADGKWRRIEPNTFPLAYDVPKRVGRLRAYGNAIVPEVAAQFIMAFMETE